MPDPKPGGLGRAMRQASSSDARARVSSLSSYDESRSHARPPLPGPRRRHASRVSAQHAMSKLSAPEAQAMTAVEDARTEHVASIDTSTGTCFCCTTPLASCLWCGLGAVRARGRTRGARGGAALLLEQPALNAPSRCAASSSARRAAPAKCFLRVPRRLRPYTAAMSVRP